MRVLTPFVKNLSLLLTSAVAVVAASVSCTEGENDYYYLVNNKTAEPIILSYTSASLTESFSDTILPGQIDTVCYRGNVSGDDIWDIETGAEMYMVSSLSVSIKDSLFIPNPRLRKYWGSVAEQNGNGVYTLDVTNDLFTMRRVKYLLDIVNGTSYTMAMPYQQTGSIEGYAVLNPSETAHFVTSSVQTYVTDLCDTTAKAKIIYLSFPIAPFFTNGIDSLYPNISFDTRVNWTFDKVVDEYGDSCGYYKLLIDDSKIHK